MSAITLGAGSVSNNSIIEDDAASYTVGGAFNFIDAGLGATGTAGDFHNLAAIGGNGTNLGTLTASLLPDALGGGDNLGSVSWSYTVNDSALQYLADGQILSEVFQVTILDSEGNSLIVPITVTITGTNDGPVFTASEAAPVETLVEDTLGTLSTFGTLTFNDVDILDTHSISNVSVAASGTTSAALTDAVLKAMLSTPVTSTTTATGGALNWSFSAANSAFDYLDAGETLTLAYTVTLSDGHGGEATKVITVNVQGTNDVATVTVANISTTEANSTTVVNDTIANHVTITDVDASDAANPTKYVASSGSVVLTSDGGPVSQPAPPMSFDTDTGAFDYDRTDYSYLAAGQSVVYTFTFDVKSGNDAPQTKSLTLTITGQNDAPVIDVSPPSVVGVTEPVSGMTTLSNAGGFDVSDVDVSNALTIGEGTPAVVWSTGGAVPAGVVAALTAAGAFTISDSDGSTTDNQASVEWILNSTADFNFLAVGETLTVTYPVTITDGTATVTRNVVVTITGTNDDPVATVDTGAATEGVTATVAAAAGVLFNDIDVDTTDVLVVSEINGLAGDVGSGVNGTNGGTFTVTANGGYTFVPGPTFENLRINATRTTSIDYTVSDGHGGFSIQTLTVTVTGTNDAPVVSGAVTGLATEDGATVTLNALANASDIDATDTLSVTGVPGTLPAGVTYDAGTHEFTLDPGNAAYQHLANGATQVVTVNYGVFDGTATTPHSVSFTITGTNDAPVVSGAVTGNATEAGTSVTLNALLNASDVDDATTLTVTSVPGVLPAGVTYDAATHSFTLDPTNAAYQSLSVGVTQLVTVAYSVSDGLASTPASVSFTVTGTNDAPVVTAGGVISGNVADPLGTGSAVAIPVTGTFAFTDVDADANNVETPTVTTSLASTVLAGATPAQTAALALLGQNSAP